MQKKERVAIFDIDGTVFRSSLLIKLVDAFIEKGMFPKRAAERYARAYARWVDRKDSYDNYIHGVIEAFQVYVKGMHYKDFVHVAKEVVQRERNKVYRFTRDLVKDLHKKGYYLLAISHSPKMVIEPFGKYLGFDKVYGMMYESDKSGRLTGKIMHEEIVFDKAKVLLRAVEKEHLTLKNSVGVGDTETDIAFLRLVEKPICFNPNSKLYVYAKRKGWEVVVERKDVVYTIK